MPYVPGSTAHGVVHVADVYHSGNTFVNSVPVALWLPAGQSAAFANDIAVDPITLDAPITAAIAANDAAYTANPENYTMPEEPVAQGAIQPTYQGTPDAVTTSTGTTSTPSAIDLIPFLAVRLDEADRGMWNRTFATTGVSNPNIVGIWKSIGLTQFTTDVTPWCMGFVNFALKACGYYWCPEAGAIAIANNPGRWHATSVPLTQGQPGDICVWNYSGAKHVNFIYTADNGKYTFVGGNQSGKSPHNNNPAGSSVSIGWPGGWTTAKNTDKSTLMSIWRPSKT